MQIFWRCQETRAKIEWVLVDLKRSLCVCPYPRIHVYAVSVIVVCTLENR